MPLTPEERPLTLDERVELLTEHPGFGTDYSVTRSLVHDALAEALRAKSAGPDLTPEEAAKAAAEVAEKLFGHRWDDLEDQDAVAERFLPIAAAIRSAAEAAYARGRTEGETDMRERCKAAVPRTWLDPILSGPDAVKGSAAEDGGRYIERLLPRIAAAIAALPLTTQGE